MADFELKPTRVKMRICKDCSPGEPMDVFYSETFDKYWFRCPNRPNCGWEKYPPEPGTEDTYALISNDGTY